MKGQHKIDEFSLILLAVLIFMGILMISWTTPSEFPPKVEPTSVSLQLRSGGSGTFDLNVTGKITVVNITTSGQVADWIKFSKNNFDVISGSVITTGTVSVPSSTAAGKYRGKITVESTGGKKEIPVTIEITQISRTASRPMDLGSFTLGFAGATAIESKESASIVKGYMYEKDFDMTAEVDSKNLNMINSAQINLDILETNGYGNLIVVFNGEEVYNGQVAAGELSIPVDKSLVRESNVIKIKAANPGFFFWANTVYNIKLAKFSINLQGSFSKELDFFLNPDEIIGFDRLQMTYKVVDYTAPVPDLTISINNQKIFSGRPELTLFNRNFVNDLSGRKIELSGSNKITFSFDQKAFYDVSNLVLTVFYGI